MTNVLVSSLVGGLVAGAVALVGAGPLRPSVAEPIEPAEIARTADREAPSAGSSTTIACAPSERAELRRVIVDGREVARAECVDLFATAASAPPAVVGFVPTAASPSAFVPAGLTTSAPAVAAPVVVRERVVTRRAPQKAARKWSTSALVIGGGTGAGAGVGGLVGGKKGALVGAAIGGGSAAIFEAIKR